MIRREDALSGDGGDVMVLRRALPSGPDEPTRAQSGATILTVGVPGSPTAGAARGAVTPPPPPYPRL